MKIVFDLDYTLLDTVKFKEALLAATGVGEKEYIAAYDEVVATNNGFFDPEKLFLEMHRRGSFVDGDTMEQAKERFTQVLMGTEKYLYPDAKELLEALAKHKEIVVELMTFGNKKWQQQKVDHSGLRALFNAVHCVDEEKKNVISRAGEGHDKVIVVNDNGKEMDEMHDAAPEYVYIFKKGPKPAPTKCGPLAAETMLELAERLEAQTGVELRREMQEIREAREAKPEAPRPSKNH